MLWVAFGWQIGNDVIEPTTTTNGQVHQPGPYGIVLVYQFFGYCEGFDYQLRVQWVVCWGLTIETVATIVPLSQADLVL